MGAKNDFWAAYQHPLWQKKRLEILEREYFTCEECESKDKQLHVHHSYYLRGNKPWEYDSESLHCLCADCHDKYQQLGDTIKQWIGKLPLYGLQELLGCVVGLVAKHDMDDLLLNVGDHDLVIGIARVFGVDACEAFGLKDESGYATARQLSDLEAKNIADRIEAKEFYEAYLNGKFDIVSTKETASV